MSEENSGSIFGKLKRESSAGQAPAAGPAAPRQAPPPPPPPPALPPPPAFLPPPVTPVNDPRVGRLEAEVAELRAELEALRNRPETPAPPPLPSGGSEEFGARLVRVEAVIEEMRLQAAAAEENAAARSGKAASREETKILDLRISDLAASFDGLKRTFAREGELAARLEQAEAGLAEFKVQAEGQQAQTKLALDGLAGKDELDALRVKVAAAAASMEEMKRRFAQYAEEFSGVERECRKALGEMQGCVKSAEQKPLAEKFDEYMKETVSRLAVKLAELETAMHAGLAEMSGKLMSGEILYKKVFTEAEGRLIKSVEPELKSVDGQLKWLRENLIRLSDDYTVVAERKMRALEGKYAAFEAISRRMDAIDAAFKMGGKIGLP